jgi:histone arginine demethylase JMJD6
MKTETMARVSRSKAVLALSAASLLLVQQNGNHGFVRVAEAVPADIPLDYIWESDRQDAMAQCEAETNCGGLVFDLVPPEDLEDSATVDPEADSRPPPFRKPQPPSEYGPEGDEADEPANGGDGQGDGAKQKKTLSQMYMDESVIGAGSKAPAPPGSSISDKVSSEPAAAPLQEPAYSVRKMLVVPLYYNAEHPEVFVSNKPWLIMRGAVKIAISSLHDTVLRTGVDMDILDARAWCEAQVDCVAFSFPLISETSLNLVDKVVFVSKIAGFEYGQSESYIKRNHEDEEPAFDFVPTKDPDPEWVTHILHDRKRLTNRVERNIDISESKWAAHSKSPYRPCCTSNATLPTLEELQAVDNLKRISCNITREEFYETYEKTRTPVMLVGCTDQWPAHKLWKDIPTVLDRFENNTQWESISGREMSWGQFREFYKESHETDGDKHGLRIFLKLNPGFPADELHQDYSVPGPFRDADVYEQLPHFKKRHFPKDFGPLHYWIVGSYGTGTGPHADPLTTDAWSTLTSGHKWWIIYPKVKHVLSEAETQCHRSCSTSMTDFHVTGKRDEVSWYASVAKHANKFHYGSGEHAKFVLQNPGETIYLPFGMIHSVMNVDETIAITEKFASMGNFAEVWREILVSGEYEDWHYMYYKILSKEQRAMARTVVWPITRDAVNGLVSNEQMYVGSKEGADEYAEEDEEDEELTILSDEEFEALSDEDQEDYLNYRDDYERRHAGETEENAGEPVVLDELEFADLSSDEKEEYHEYVESYGEGWEEIMPYVASYFGIDVAATN